jgi:hypothetical protein
MSTGIGKTQRAILDELNSTQDGHLSVVALASRLSRSPRQIRTAVHALAKRELIVATKQGQGWSGVGQYGPLRRRDTGFWGENGRQEYGPEVPTAHTERHGYTDYDDDTGAPIRAHYVTEFVHAGTPNGVSLFAWLPEAHQARQELARNWR